VTDCSASTEMTYRYDADYLASLTAGWTRLSFPVISALVRATLEAHAPDRILDFGAGAGAYAGVLSYLGGEVSACDVSAECVAACDGSYSSVFLVEGPADLPSNAYDMVFSTEVLEHVRDYDAALRHFHRALRPKGVVLLTTTGYSTSLFTMLGQARGSGVGWLDVLRASGAWLAGYLSLDRRDRFVERWCFAPLGGHYHGFTRRGLLTAFGEAGFSVERSGMLFIVEPIQLPFLSSHSARSLLRRDDWPTSKRWTAAAAYVAARPLSRLMKRAGLFANNLYMVAVKDDSSHDPARG